MTSVQWPGKSIFNPNEGDISKPLTGLLKALRDMDATDAEGNSVRTSPLKTPPSLQVITAGASAVSKIWTLAIAALGGGTAIWAAIKGLWTSTTTSVQASFVFAGAGLGAAVCISVAIIVRGDVASRAVATSSRRQARAEITAAVLDNYQYVKAAEALAFESQYVVQRTSDSKWYKIDSLGIDDQGVLMTIQDANKSQLHSADIKAVFDLSKVGKDDSAAR